MDVYNEIYDGFMRAFRYCVAKEGYGGRSFLAAKVGISTAMMSKILHKTNPKPISKNLQVKLANAFGYELAEFIEFGRNLLSGDENSFLVKKTPISNVVTPFEIKEPSSEIDSITRDHIEIVKKFKFKELAKNINEDLLRIENQETLKEVEVLVKAISLGMGFEVKLVGKNNASSQQVPSEGKFKKETGS